MPKKRAALAPSPLGSYLSATDKATARHRYMGLLHDYQDLVKEIDTRKLGLLKAKQKKHKLVAEVKFLRKKLNSFLADDSLKMSHRLEKLPYIPALSSGMYSSGLPSQAHQEDGNHKETAAVDLNQVSYRPAPPSARYVQLNNSGLPSNKAHLEASNHRVREAAILGRGSTALLDLNQVSYRPAPPSARYAQMPNSVLLGKAHLEDRNQKVTNAASRNTTTSLDLNEAQICTTDMPRYAQQLQLSAPSARNAQMHNADLASKAHPEDRNHEVTEAASRRTAALDLNQYVEEFEQEPYRIDNLKRFSGSNVATMNDHKLFCRGSGNEPNQVSRRKIPLQDQLPLRV